MSIDEDQKLSIPQQKSALKASDVLNSNLDLSIPADLLAPDEYEQIGAVTRKKALAHGELILTRDLARTETWEKGSFIVGRTIENDVVQLGIGDDAEEQAALLGNKGERHIILIAETRSGKSERFLVPNLAHWPGSAVVIDPKGELATVTAERRCEGNPEFCDQLDTGQRVYVLDPERLSNVPNEMFACFNPLDWLKENDIRCIQKARILAAALLPDEETGGDPYWKNEGRDLLAVVMAHVATEPDLNLPRTLNTVYKFLRAGEIAAYQEMMEIDGKCDQTPMGLFFTGLINNPMLGDFISDAGNDLNGLFQNAVKQWEGIRSQAKQSLSWVETPTMKASLSKSNFSFDELRTNPEGVTVYITAADMELDCLWLRMLTEIFMADSKGSTLPASNCQTLLILDEFPQMKHMPSMVKAVGGIAGYGVRLCVVVQSLVQLQATYPKSWELFLSNADLQIYFGTNSGPTAEYISKKLGEKQEVLMTRGFKIDQGQTSGSAEMKGSGSSRGTSNAEQSGSTNTTNEGTSKNFNRPDKLRRYVPFVESLPKITQGNVTTGKQAGSSKAVTNSTTTTSTENTSIQESTTKSTGDSRNIGVDFKETLHKIPIIAPSDVPFHLARVDDRQDERYPGQALIILSGGRQSLVRTLKYYDDEAFYRTYCPDPRYPFKQAPLPYHLRVNDKRQARLNYENTQQSLFEACLKESEYRDEKLREELNKPVVTIVLTLEQIEELAKATLFGVLPNFSIDEGYVEQGETLLSVRKIPLVVMPFDGNVKCEVRYDDDDEFYCICISDPPFEESEITRDLRKNGRQSKYFVEYVPNEEREYKLFSASPGWKSTWEITEEFKKRGKEGNELAKKPFYDLQYAVIDYRNDASLTQKTCLWINEKFRLERKDFISLGIMLSIVMPILLVFLFFWFGPQRFYDDLNQLWFPVILVLASISYYFTSNHILKDHPLFQPYPRN